MALYMYKKYVQKLGENGSCNWKHTEVFKTLLLWEFWYRNIHKPIEDFNTMYSLSLYKIQPLQDPAGLQLIKLLNKGYQCLTPSSLWALSR